MPLRYLVIAGPAADRSRFAERIERNTGLRLIVENSSYTIFTGDGTQAIVDEKSSYVIIGHLFYTVQPQRVSRLDPATIDRLRTMGGRELVQNYWGAYVSISSGENPSEVHIQRDPLETAPCYYFRYQELWIIVSDLAAAKHLGVAPVSVDWNAIAAQVLRPDLRTERTCLSDITELPGGQQLTFGSRGKTIATLWTPSKFSPVGKKGIDRNEAVERVRRVVLNCIHSWASCYKNILVQVSGGLDSSIIAASLKGKHINASTMTISTTQPEGDERNYARLLTRHLDLPLQEMFFDPLRVDITRSDSVHLPRPVARSHVQETDRLTLLAANNVGADVVFNGNSGDAVFCFLQSISPVVDRIVSQGLGIGAVSTAFDISRITGVSVWKILKRAIWRSFSSRRPYRWRIDTRFLHPDIVSAGPDNPAHGWFDPEGERLPGQAGQLAGIVQSHYHREGFARGGSISMISPLLSQPLVELCLEIPSWLWCEGGINRLLARAAFSSDLPQEIVQRRSKGSPDSFLLAILEMNRSVLTDWLCGGLLAEHQLIDVDYIRQYLNRSGPIAGIDYIRILDLADVESWARAQNS